MRIREVRLPGPVVVVPSAKLEARVRQQARDHPYLPVDLSRIAADLDARTNGAAVTVERPRGDGDPSLLVHTRHYVLRLFPTRSGRAYVIGAVTPLDLRDHHRLAQGCLLVRPAGWQVAYELRSVPSGVSAYWDRLQWEWGELDADLPPAQALSRSHADYLDRLDRMIDATQRLTTEAARPARPFAYVERSATAERRHGVHAVYEFRLGSATAPEEGAFVQVRGEPGQRGQVIRVAGAAVTVRFDQPVDWSNLAPQGELELTASTVVFDKQREAVGLLRSGRAPGSQLLPALVDRQVAPVRRRLDDPVGTLDKDQLLAFRAALSTEDMLLVLGPPGTGKTRTIGEIARAAAFEGGPVLVTAQSNRAVDNVLPKLPADLVVIRVGHEGKITPDGQPFLLETRAAELRQGILDATDRALAAHRDLEQVAAWTVEAHGRMSGLREAVARRTGVQTQLTAHQRSYGGTAVARLDAALAELRRHEDEGRANEEALRRLRTRKQQLAARVGPNFLRLLLEVVLERRLAKRLARGRRLATALDTDHAELAEAERDLDLASRHHPVVIEARTFLDEAIAEEQARGLAVVQAAATIRNGLSRLGPVPELSRWPTEAQLREFLSWSSGQLPMHEGRARLLTQWREEAATASAQLHPELLRYADVIAATCIGSASRPELTGIEFALAIVDEAGQIGTTDLVVPLARSRRAVLVGDHQQLPPYLDSDVDAWGRGIEDPVVRRSLSRSALELLMDDGFPGSHIVPLTQQRRMPEVIAEFISRRFYGGRLQTKVHRDHSDALFSSSLAFVDTARLPAATRRERDAAAREAWGQRGYDNPAEARLLADLAAWYHRLGVDWAVVVPYRAQVAAVQAGVRDLLGAAAHDEANVGTVDTFQGGERDVVLFGHTRSNPNGGIGFLKELRRANVAFTRARSQLVIVGDSSTLTRATDPDYRDLAIDLLTYTARHGDLREYADVVQRLARLDAGRLR